MGGQQCSPTNLAKGDMWCLEGIVCWDSRRPEQAGGGKRRDTRRWRKGQGATQSGERTKTNEPGHVWCLHQRLRLGRVALAQRTAPTLVLVAVPVQARHGAQEPPCPRITVQQRRDSLAPGMCPQAQSHGRRRSLVPDRLHTSTDIEGRSFGCSAPTEDIVRKHAARCLPQRWLSARATMRCQRLSEEL